jgi:hypothetical protein
MGSQITKIALKIEEKLVMWEKSAKDYSKNAICPYWMEMIRSSMRISNIFQNSVRIVPQGFQKFEIPSPTLVCRRNSQFLSGVEDKLINCLFEMIVSGHKPNGLNPIRSITTSSLSIGQVGSSFQKHRYYYRLQG